MTLARLYFATLVPLTKGSCIPKSRSSCSCIFLSLSLSVHKCIMPILSVLNCGTMTFEIPLVISDHKHKQSKDNSQLFTRDDFWIGVVFTCEFYANTVFEFRSSNFQLLVVFMLCFWSEKKNKILYLKCIAGIEQISLILRHKYTNILLI